MPAAHHLRRLPGRLFGKALGYRRVSWAVPQAMRQHIDSGRKWHSDGDKHDRHMKPQSKYSAVDMEARRRVINQGAQNEGDFE
jgi:type 1 glutamine amidotransferase